MKRFWSQPLRRQLFIAILLLLAPVLAAAVWSGVATYRERVQAGPAGATGPQGPLGPGASRANIALSGVVPFPANSVCLNIGVVEIEVPAGSPVGVLIAAAKVSVKVFHNQGIWDRGFLVFSTVSGTDCPTIEQYRSYFSVPLGYPTMGTGTASSPFTPIDFTVFVQAPYRLPASAPPVTVTHRFYLNGQMMSGATLANSETMGDATMTVEFHPDGAPPPPTPPPTPPAPEI